MSQGIKYCYWCKSFKTLDAFNKNKAAKDGLQKKCRECNKITLRAHKEKIALQKGKSLKPYAEKSFSSITSDELINYLKLFSNLINIAPTT